MSNGEGGRKKEREGGILQTMREIDVDRKRQRRRETGK